MLKRHAILCAALFFAAVLMLGLARLFELRFDRGDVYPPYSTLRGDPLGASVLYESLDSVPGVSAQRYFDQAFNMDNGHAHALFILGARWYDTQSLPRQEFDTLQRFVYNGGRVVIAYYPEADEAWNSSGSDTNETSPEKNGAKGRRHYHRRVQENPDDSESQTNQPANPETKTGARSLNSTNTAKTWPRSLRDARRHKNSPDQKDQQDEDESKEELLHYAVLTDQWGFQFEFKPLESNDEGAIDFPKARLTAPAGAADLPALLPVHTGLCFTNLTNGWITVYQLDKKTPVVIERKFGAGSVVLVADAYPFSNEALFKDRSAAWVAWMLGNGRDVIFDEAHLGIVEQPGMATLMRRYHLHGLIFSLLLAGALFVWKNSLSLAPPYAETEDGAGPLVAGRDSASGFVNLVRRGIAPADIINVCHAEWKKSGARQAALSQSQRRDMEQLISQQAALEPRLRKPVENYRVLSQIVRRRT